MSESIILNIAPELLGRFQEHAQIEQMSLHDFIVEAAERYIAQNEYVSIDDLAEILEKEHLLD